MLCWTRFKSEAVVHAIDHCMFLDKLESVNYLGTKMRIPGLSKRDDTSTDTDRYVAQRTEC
jgi:hypothetical protein